MFIIYFFFFIDKYMTVFDIINFQPLPKNDNNNCERKCGMVKEAMKEISQQVLPGSNLIANNCARCCNYESLQDLKQYRVYSVEQLQKLDKSYGNNLLSNLGEILIHHFFRLFLFI